MISNAYASETETLTIKDADPIPPAPETAQSGWASMVPLILIFVVFYFFLIRPQEKKRKEHEELIKTTKKGDKVITNAGIFGTVIKVNDSDDTVEVEIAPETNIKILKSAIANILDKKKDKTEKPEKSKNKK